MLKFLKFIGWLLSFPFVTIWLLIEFKSCYVAGKRYKKDPTSSLKEERYEKVRKLVKHFLFWKRIKIENVGKEKIEKKVMLFVSNHKSNVDPLVILKFVLDQELPFVTFVAKKEIQNTKIGHIADLLDVIYVDRGNIREVPQVLDNMVKTLQGKSSICLFAEGTRVSGDEIAEFKPTLLEAAYRTHMSIQPTVIYNSEGLLDKNKKPSKNRTVYISMLKNINSNSFINMERSILSKRIHEKISHEYNKVKNNIVKNK